MTLIWVILKVLVFALCAGAIISVLVFVPLTLYVIPYTLWVGSQNTKGKQLDKKKEPVFQAVRNATKLYKAKLTGHEPIF
jgi:hypothetical protein